MPDNLSTYDLSRELDDLEGMASAYIDNPDVEAPLDEDEQERLDALRALADELGGEFGEANLIHEDNFEDYAQEYAEEIGAIPYRHPAWPLNCIDWEQAANELRSDYSAVEFDGDTYYVR